MHPDIIVESALLAGVNPPDITYKHHLQACPDDIKGCFRIHQYVAVTHTAWGLLHIAESRPCREECLSLFPDSRRAGGFG